MFQRIEYLTGTGTIDFELTKYILPHLFPLKDNFTCFGLSAALRLPGKYAKRIYPFCSQWKDLGETKKYELQDFKKMLSLLDDKGNEKLKAFKDFRVNILDVSVKQINMNTELHVRYKLEKVGRYVKNILFKVKSQVDSIPFDLATPTPQLLGVPQNQYENAVRILDELRITNAKHRQTILASAAHIAEVNRYRHDLKTGKVKMNRNAEGLLLVRLGLVAAKSPKASV